MCGGTSPAIAARKSSAGLSPCVRGNPVTAAKLSGGSGSIPVCAGEPGNPAHQERPLQVYPRVCGGTIPSTCRRLPPAGLSPRVRGNPYQRGASAGAGGSIPACAGEPERAVDDASAVGVYPRVCGGTQHHENDAEGAEGLSPRVRGNLHPVQPGADVCGSIPACAGEPKSDRSGTAPLKVYPRVCGGTRDRASSASDGIGLSPRVRGNLLGIAAGDTLARSIPACAGEPPR